MMDIHAPEATKRLMDTHAERTTTRLIADYREWSNRNLTPIACRVLDRLEKDPGFNGEVQTVNAGVVTAAFNHRTLKKAHPGLLLFYLIQSIELAEAHEKVVEDCLTRANSFRSAASKAKELATFCDGNVPLRSYSELRQLEKYLTDQADLYSKQPARLHINQKTTDESRSLLALRAFADRLRKNFGFERLPHDPIKWLIGTALGCKVTDNQLTEGLRLLEVGESEETKSHKSPRPAKTLKKRNIFKQKTCR